LNASREESTQFFSERRSGATVDIPSKPIIQGENAMKKPITLYILFLCVAVLFSFSACQTPAGRSAGQVIDDGTITTKVKAKLFDESILRGFAISVQTFEGTTTLTGAVDTEEQKERAGQIAASTEGVKNVNNLLKIKKK
jgi:hyperosmotically inducible protein